MKDHIDNDGREPKLLIEVNIGKHGMQKIVVYDGDSAEYLADQFCQKYGLNSDMKEKLRRLLDEQIAGVLPKIVEDDDADADDSFGNEKKKN